MKDLLLYIARNLVDDPDSVSVTEVQGDQELTLELRVAPDDMGKVIGRQGRIAKEIRTVVRSYAQRRAYQQSEAQHRLIHPKGGCHAAYHRQHGGRIGDVVHKGGDQHRSPDDDGIGQEQVSAAHSRDDMAEIINDPRPFNAPDHQEQSCQQR